MTRRELTAITSHLYRNDIDRELWNDLWVVLKANSSHPRDTIQTALTPELLPLT